MLAERCLIFDAAVDRVHDQDAVGSASHRKQSFAETLATMTPMKMMTAASARGLPPEFCAQKGGQLLRPEEDEKPVAEFSWHIEIPNRVRSERISEERSPTE